MNNVFKDFDVGVRYDLKGSVTGRDLLAPDQDLNYVAAKGIKTALKCNDFRRLQRQIILDEEELRERGTVMDRKFHRTVFRDVLRKDADFFSRTDIIDYSLLLGEVVTDDVEDLKEQVKINPELGQGLYFDVDGKAWVIGIIDPLTGFNFKKACEYRFKQIRHGHEMSCVPPRIYARRFQNFMLQSI